MRLRVNIQSIGDVITNSSSEVYCIYNTYGTKQLVKSVKNIIKSLAPDIDMDDHLEINLIPNEDMDIYDESKGEDVSFNEFYNNVFNDWCLNKSNEEVLFGFCKWLENFQQEYATDERGHPYWDLEIKPLTDLGEELAKSIWGILNAYDHEEIYD